ncbi:MAG: hypothetical protein JW889_07475 [Verrucomicrobia bacterium]|nr:hypothetical protein [Verrucomicrobiota bacterium]
MAIVVENKRTLDRYVLIGTGYGAYRSERPGLFLGNWMPDEKSGAYPMAAVATLDGEIGRFCSDQVRVASVDGRKVSELLQP